VTVEIAVGLLAADDTCEEILKEYPFLERDDIVAALSRPRGVERSRRLCVNVQRGRAVETAGRA